MWLWLLCQWAKATQCVWYVADASTASGPEDFVPYPSFAEALAASVGFTAAMLVWDSVPAAWYLDGSDIFVSIRYTPSGVHTGWNWRIGVVGNSNQDSGVGGLPSAAAALADAQAAKPNYLPVGFCT